MTTTGPGYQFSTPAITFTKPFLSFVTTVTSSITSGAATVTSLNTTSTITYMSTSASLTSPQVSSVNSVIQSYTDPVSTWRSINLANMIGVNQNNPQYELDLQGQANIIGGLTIQQSPGSALATMGTSGSLTIDWAPLPIGGTIGTNNSYGFRWQLRDLSNNQCDLNLLTNISSSSAIYVSSANGFVGINNVSPKCQLDLVGNFNISGTQTSSAINAVTCNSTITSSQQIILPNASSFTGLYSDLSKLPLFSIFNNSSSPAFNLKIWVGTATTSGGSVSVFPTNNSLPSGTPIFNTIIHANALAWSVASSVTGISVFSGKSISTNCSSVSFYGITGSSVIVGGNTVAYVPNGINVSALLIGT